MKKRKSSLEDFFDTVAAKYNEERIVQGGRLFNEFIEMPATKSLIDKKRIKGARVLDVGCGIGSYSKYFAENGAHVIAIDVSKNMLKIAEQNCKDYKGCIEYVHSKFEDFECGKRQFNYIIGGFMLGYFDDLESSFKKIAHCLKDDGVAIFSMLHPLKLSSKRIKGRLVIEDYFDENDYLTDLDFNQTNVSLKNWNEDDITKASESAGLVVSRIIVPKPELPIGYSNKKALEYFKFPAVMIFKFLKYRNGK